MVVDRTRRGCQAKRVSQGQPDADTLVDGLEEEMRQALLRAMPPDATGELAQNSLADLLIIYGTWTSRLIAKRPRKVHQSKEMLASPRTASHRSELDELIAKIETGEDLRPHLSKRVETAFLASASAANTPNQARADRDVLLANRGIHHLHLSSDLEANGRWVKRGGDLLYAVLGPNDAYLLGVYGHGDWALKQLVEIIVRNWPDIGIVYKLNALGLASPEPSDDELLLLQNAGVVTMFEVDGAVWTFLGQTTAGTPIMATRAANELMHTLRRLRADLLDRLTKCQTDVEQIRGLKLSGDWYPTVIGRLAGFRCDDVFDPVANLDAGEVTGLVELQA